MTKPGDGSGMPPISDPGAEESSGRSDETPRIEGYEIAGRLGEGGMGTVWRAVQLSTRREVALKVVGRGAFTSGKAIARFEREVELTARLQHPNIARVYDSGRHRDAHYYAMELIAGIALDEYVQKQKLGQREILELMGTVCEAVQHAHERGVIHRDLKPSNILVTPDGQPHIVDFGLAKGLLEKDSALRLSTEGEAAGTPAYMSPEQAGGRAEQIDTRTDVYSLGVILFRLLTGESPHDLSGTRYEVLRRIAEEEARRPREITKDVDRELEALLLKALAHGPKGRYSYAGALAQDIRNYLTGEPLTARPPTAIYFLRKRLWKHRVPLAIAFSVLVLVIGIAVFEYIRVVHERNKAVAAKHRALRKAQRENYYDSIALAQGMIADLRMHEASVVLWDTPKELRGWEWGRLMHACREVPLILKGHSGNVTAVAISPDGKRVATASDDFTAKIWDAKTGQQVLTLKGHSAVVTSVAFSPAGDQVVTGSHDNTVRVWDVETGREILTVKPPPGFVLSVAFSPDGKRVLMGTDDHDVARISDAETGREIFTLKGHRSAVNSVAFSPEGKRVVTGSNDRTAKVWDAETGREIMTLSGHSDRVLSVDFSPCARRAATGSRDLTARVWDIETGHELLVLTGHASSVNSVEFSPDGRRIATGSADGTARVWDVETGRELLVLMGHASGVNSLVFSPDGKRVVTGSDDNTAIIWDALDWNLSPQQFERELAQWYSRRLYNSRRPVEGKVLFYDGFYGKLKPDWKVLHPDPSRFSLSKLPRTLTITTQYGTFDESSTDYKNLFLIDCPAPPGDDFQLTARILSFKPVSNYNQAGLICYNDDDNWLNFYNEWNSFHGGCVFTIGAETDGTPTYGYLPAPEELAGVRLRITKQGNRYTFSTSLDGKSFVPKKYPYRDAMTTEFFHGGVAWGDGSVRRVGLFAMNSYGSAAPEIDASFDFFEVRSLLPAEAEPGGQTGPGEEEGSNGQEL